jgi:hypothetical protein
VKRLAGLLLLVPQLAFAQAEPAPENYVPPAERGQPQAAGGELPKLPPDLPRWMIAVSARMALPVGTPPADLPNIGLGGGVTVHRALVPLGRWLRFGVGFDFAYDRVFKDLGIYGTAQLAHATFAGVGVFDALIGPGQRVRPFIGIGGGLSLGDFENPTTKKDVPSESVVEPLGLVHLTAGLGVRVYQSFEVGVHYEVNFTFSSTQGGMPPRPLFQPGFAELALDLGFRF